MKYNLYILLLLSLCHCTTPQIVSEKPNLTIPDNTKEILKLISTTKTVQRLAFQLEDKSVEISPNADIQKIKTALWNKYKKEQQNTVYKKEHDAKALTYSDKTMRFGMTKKGKKPANGYPLYIALHGGGGTANSINDSQWEAMKSYYLQSVETGVYVAPRGVTNTWNLHFVGESYPLYERMIQNMILFEDVDPNRVYFLGYSAGGDGVYQVVPRMADRFAAANMSAGHPNGVNLENLYHVPFLIQVGEKDAAYKRNMVSVEYAQQLAGLQKQYPDGYKHDVFVHWEKGHSYVQDHSGAGSSSEIIANPAEWLANPSSKKSTSKNTDAIAWMSQYTRSPYPTHIIWNYDTKWDSKQRFYWLFAGNKGLNKSTKHIEVMLDKSNNRIIIKRMGTYIKLFLTEGMLDFSKPIQVDFGNKKIGMIHPKANLRILVNTMMARSDKSYMFERAIEVEAKESIFVIK